MSVPSSTVVRIRSASFEDHSRIASLMERYKLESKTAEEWIQLWESNPEFTRVGKEWPIGWVLEDACHQLVGYVGNIPVGYELRGRHLTAAVTHAWVVDAGHRRSTLLLVHRYFSQKRVDLFVDASANYGAGKIFEAMHGHRVPSPRSDVALFWVTDHPGFVSSLLKTKGLPCGRVVTQLLGGLAWVTSESKRLARRLRSRGRQRWETIQFLAQFDERFDEFWDRLRMTRDMIWCVRDRQSLDWHFRYALTRGDAWILVATQGSTISAYAIVLRQDNRAVGLKRARLVDFQALPGSEGTLAHMMSAALVRCRTEGVHMLESIGFGGATRCFLEAHAPYRRRLPAWMFFYKARDQRLDQELSRAELWDVCSYDGDGSL